MLSDVCFEFYRDIEGISDDKVRESLDELKSGIQHYREYAHIKYDSDIFTMMDKFVEDFEAKRIGADRLRDMLRQVVMFYDDSQMPPTSVLFTRLDYKPS